MNVMRVRKWVPFALGVATVAYVFWLEALAVRWDKTTAASVGQAVGTFAAVATALWIGYRDRRDVVEHARQERAADREAFLRRRDYDESLRLLQLVEQDRRAWEEAGSSGDRPRSIEATALVRALWGRRNWWGTVWDWYVDFGSPDNRFAHDRAVPNDLFSEMQREIAEAILRLDWQDRQRDDSWAFQHGSRQWLADRVEAMTRWLRKSTER
jgi:hypothetical protein